MGDYYWSIDSMHTHIWFGRFSEMMIEQHHDDALRMVLDEHKHPTNTHTHTTWNLRIWHVARGKQDGRSESLSVVRETHSYIYSESNLQISKDCGLRDKPCFSRRFFVAMKRTLSDTRFCFVVGTRAYFERSQRNNPNLNPFPLHLFLDSILGARSFSWTSKK